MASFQSSALAEMVAKGVVEIPGLKRTSVDRVGGILCHICHATYSTKKQFDSHYSAHGTGRAVAGIVYTCLICRKEISGYPSFRNHCYNQHVIKDKFNCTHCSKKFAKASELQLHNDTKHTYKCTSCKKQFPTKTELHLHQLIHKNEKDMPPYDCNSCGKLIDSVDMCELHIDEHTSITYPCPICDIDLPSKADATSHLTIHFGEVLTDSDEIVEPAVKEDCSLNIVGGILCCYCGDLFKTRDEFDNHFLFEHSDKHFVYSCNICGKQYDKDKYSGFANHCYLHIARDRFECEECGKTFPRLSLLVVHTEAFHGQGEVGAKPFACACGHAFGSERRLREHSLLAHNEVSVRCLYPDCDMSFGSSQQLIVHRKLRHGARGAWCRRCGLALGSAPAAERHLPLHRRATYRCPVCRKPYHEKFTLLKHVPVHFETVLHVCKVCGRGFGQRSRLVQHSKTHSALRPHTCVYCGKGFVTHSNLQQHLNVHTGHKHKCTECPKTFTSYPNWLKHLRRMHNVDGKLIKKGMNAAKITKPPENQNSELENTVISDMKQSEPGDLADSEDSSLDGIDPATLNREWQMLGHATLELPIPSLLAEDTTATETSSSMETLWYPREYGPEIGEGAGQLIDLDDHMLPHIDPLLTIKETYVPQPQYDAAPYEQQTSWEPPVITKFYTNSFEDMTNVNRLSILKRDIF